MEFKVLSHAAMLVRCGATSIVIDPWLVGSCYWRSWWNFPRAVFDADEMAAVDAVVVTHLHWDHWHGPSLRRFFRGKPVFVPDEPHRRSADDLRRIGFDDVRRLPHGKTVVLGDLRLTLHQFGRYVNDAAVVVEGDGVTLLNANDAKIAGLPLRHLLARHGPVDFAFRSHSSANSRLSWRMDGDEALVVDDREHYFRAFEQFMDAVQPRFAVPFASNHCHLHDDVWHFNAAISNPLQLRDHAHGHASRWTLQVMLPGSSWRGERGERGEAGRFVLAPETPFADIGATLARYRDDEAPALERQRRLENAVVVDERLLARFLGYFSATRRPFGLIRLALRWPDGRRQVQVCNLDAGTVVAAGDATRAEPGLPLIEMPAIVFRDAVVKNMFGHAGISKRCLYAAANGTDMARLGAVVTHLDRHELGLLPRSWRYRVRLASAYVRRWRELAVYAQALWLLKVKKLPIWLVEEDILKRGSAAPKA